MKKLLIFIVTILAISCSDNKNVKNNSGINIISIKVDTVDNVNLTISQRVDSLEATCNLYSHSKSSIKEQNNVLKKFFLFFPDNYSLFVNIFGYKTVTVDSSFYAPLYDNSDQYVELFYKSNGVVNDSLFIKKAIDISLNGRWQADAVNYFKNDLFKLIDTKRNMFYNVLKTYSIRDVNSFWTFYFDEPHPENLEFSKLNGFRGLDTQMYNIMESCYKKALIRGCKGA